MNIPKFSHASSHSEDHNDHDRPFYRQGRFWKIVVIVLVVLLLFRYCSSSHKKAVPAGQPVVLGKAHSGDVPVYISGLGAVTPTASVTVRTQINGQLMRVFFQEGQMVKAGELLAQIDSRPYEALLMQYEGQLARDQALLANALVDLNRYKKLWSQNSVARQVYDTQVSVVKQDQGTVKIDQGLVAGTQLNLTYTNIVSPVDGRIGLRLVDQGNYVQTSDTNGLVVIDTLNPMTVISTIAEDSVPQVMEQINAGKTLSVTAYDRTQTKLLATGKLLTIDNQMDPTTGTVKLRSQFQNDKNLLFPNQFVNVNLLVTTLKDATIVPTAAIQHGAQGPYIYVIVHNQDAKAEKPQATSKHGNKEKSDMTVKSTPVVIGVSIDDETTITKGIAPGDEVVVEGADKLTDGSPVYVSGSKSPTAEAANHTRRRDLA
jgi:multidrug efflux system membrane fusion protein